MKRFVSIAAILMIMFATFGVGVVTAQGKPIRGEIKEKRLLHLYDVFFHQMEKHRIGMEAIIDYVGDTNAGSAQLVVIKDDFVALVGELETAAMDGNAGEFRIILKDARDLTKDFRLESHSVLGTEGEIGKARTRVNEALEENKEYLQTLLGNIQQSRKGAELEIIDEANDEAQGRIDDIEEKGMNVEELQAKLDEIKEKRDALKEKLEVAIASCEGIGLGVCNTTKAQEYRDLKEEIKQDYKELREISRKIGQAHRIANAIQASHRVIERMDSLISNAEERGADVTVAKAKLDEVVYMLDSVEAEYNESNYEGALAELKNAKEALKGSGIKKAIERKVEAIKGRKTPAAATTTPAPTEEEEVGEENVSESEEAPSTLAPTTQGDEEAGEEGVSESHGGPSTLSPGNNTTTSNQQ